jgi:predicted HTH domain antitoxin
LAFGIRVRPRSLIRNVIGKRVGHVSESATPIKNHHPFETEAIQPAISPPNMPKSSKSSVEREGRISLAVKAIQNGQIKSVREAARIFEVPRSTLQDRLNGIKFRKETRANSYKLTPIEEESLVKWILSLD